MNKEKLELFLLELILLALSAVVVFTGSYMFLSLKEALSNSTHFIVIYIAIRWAWERGYKKGLKERDHYENI